MIQASAITRNVTCAPTSRLRLRGAEAEESLRGVAAACFLGSADCFPIPTAPNKSADTLIIENELGNCAPDIHVAHERQCAVIEDEPLVIDPDCNDRMIFVCQTVPQHDDLHRIL